MTNFKIWADHGGWYLGEQVARDEADAKERIVRSLSLVLAVSRVDAFERLHGPLTVVEAERTLA